MEQALQEAIDAGELSLPVITVDFAKYGPTGDTEEDAKEGRLLDAVGKITSLQVPHRLADAILRDSEHNGEAFRKSPIGRRLNLVGPLNATAVYELCPTALLFGMWDSTGPKGGLGAKFERAVVSEVVGIEAEVGDVLRGVRRDPLEIRASVPILKNGDGSWCVAEDPKKKGIIRPSEVNQGNVIFPKKGEERSAGVTVQYAEQTTTLSLIALRRLRFPLDHKSKFDENAADAAGRAVLAALGLCAATLAFESGMGLRSRCLLWPEGPMHWELLATPGETPQSFALDAAAAERLLAEAVTAAEQTGLSWRKEPLALDPSRELLKLVRMSQQQAAKEGAAQES
jgi:CRISPR-associated protein Csb1